MCLQSTLVASNIAGSNAFRFSLEWSRVMPTPSDICKDAVARFHDILDCCRRHKLEPFVTLYHFCHPQWFEKLGGFVKQENIQIFVDWCLFAFAEFGARCMLLLGDWTPCHLRLGSKARFWATMNEANVQVCWHDHAPCIGNHHLNRACVALCSGCILQPTCSTFGCALMVVRKPTTTIPLGMWAQPAASDASTCCRL